MKIMLTHKRPKFFLGKRQDSAQRVSARDRLHYSAKSFIPDYQNFLRLPTEKVSGMAFGDASKVIRVDEHGDCVLLFVANGHSYSISAQPLVKLGFPVLFVFDEKEKEY